MASHALAIHGSGGGRRVGVLESWTLAGMRGLHNKSLKLTPKAYLWFVWGPAASRSEGFAMADSAAQLSSMLGGPLLGTLQRYGRQSQVGATVANRDKGPLLRRLCARHRPGVLT